MSVIFYSMFYIVFFAVFAIVIISFAKEIVGWFKNNNSPRLSVRAKIVDKHWNTSHHHNHRNGHMHTTSSTFYYVTFEVDSGDRMEFAVPRNEYGLLAEGDRGTLSFQGTRYIGFERN